MIWKRFFVKIVYVDLKIDLFYFVNLTSSYSLIPKKKKKKTSNNKNSPFGGVFLFYEQLTHSLTPLLIAVVGWT